MEIVVVVILKLLNVMFMLLLARAVLSWFVNPYSRGGSSNISSALFKANEVIVQLTDFLVVPCRKVSSKFNSGMLDFSIMLAMLVVYAAKYLIIVLFKTFLV